MAVLTNQLQRLSYTRRDLELIDDEVDKFISHFIPVIKNTGKANIGRLFLRIVEGLIDKLNYSVDMRFRQSVLRTVKELQAAIDISELVRYKPSGVATASADLTATTLGGVAAGAGGIAIAQYSQFLTNTAPVKPFIASIATSIPEGSTSGTIEVIQGIRVVDQVILASAIGEPNEEITMPVARTPEVYLEGRVAAETWTKDDDL